MVYTIEKQQSTDNQAYSMQLPVLLDPIVLKAARDIYRIFYSVHPNHPKRPIGIAIDPETQRGKLIFGKKPVLLPHECFVPLTQLESEMY